MNNFNDPVLAETIAGVCSRLALEFRGTFSAETVERYVTDTSDLWVEARVSSFLPVLVERFARQRLQALAKVEGRTMSGKPEVLFVCVHNAGRSQMAAALLDHHAQGRVDVRSAGSLPAERVNQGVVAVMDEWGIDLSKEFPKPLTDEVVRAADVVVTMGCATPAPSTPASATGTGSWKTRPASPPARLHRSVTR